MHSDNAHLALCSSRFFVRQEDQHRSAISAPSFQRIEIIDELVRLLCGPRLVLNTNDEARRFDHQIDLSAIPRHHFSSNCNRLDNAHSRQTEFAEQRVQEEYALTVCSPWIEEISYDPAET